MKKTLSLLLLGCVVLSSAACSSTSEASVTNSGINQVDSESNKVVEGGDEMVDSQEDKVEFTKVKYGDTISKDFVEMTIEKAATAQELKPTDTTGVYSYMADRDGETYFYLTGTIKNIGTDSYSVEEMKIEFCFDDKYNYSGYVKADDGGNDFYGDYVKPFGSVKYYIYASIPDELISSYSNCVIRFAFADDFGYKSSFDDFDEYDHRYEIKLNK